MDKNTLSNYGWIVIAVLVLSVMIALATPFGSYIEQGVRSTTAGLFDTSEKALNVVGMSAGSGNFEDGYTGVYGSGESSEPETLVAGATFSGYFVYDEIDHLYKPVEEPKTLTWEELKDPANGEKYRYNASAITDTTIDDNAFDGCETLTSISVPEGVTTIGVNAFAHRNSLESITLPDSLTTIGDGAFYSCWSLTSINIPNGVITIGNNVFMLCTSLTSITFEGTIAQWNAITFGNDWNYVVPATVVHCTDGDITL